MATALAQLDRTGSHPGQFQFNVDPYFSAFFNTNSLGSIGPFCIPYPHSTAQQLSVVKWLQTGCMAGSQTVCVARGPTEVSTYPAELKSLDSEL